jgi:RNA polymerase sigma factor (sigma-70 family)
MSDERLAALVHRGDESAFVTLHERYREPLARYCRSIVHDAEDARDAQQNTMIAALRALRDRPLQGRVKPWLYKIAHNESVTVLRRRRGHEQLDEQRPAPGDAEEHLENWEALVTDLRSLPERQRGALLLRELAGLQYEEIAGVFAITPVAARKSVFEARAALAQTASGRDTACDEIRMRISDGDGRVLRARQVRGHLDSCAACTAFADGLRDRRRVLGMIPVLPVSAASLAAGFGGAGLTGAGVGAGAAGGGLGGAVIGGGALSATAIKAVATCAVCAIAGSVVLGSTHHTVLGHAHRQPAAHRIVAAVDASRTRPTHRTPLSGARHVVQTAPHHTAVSLVVAPPQITARTIQRPASAPARHSAATAGTHKGTVPTPTTAAPPTATTPASTPTTTAPTTTTTAAPTATTASGAGSATPSSVTLTPAQRLAQSVQTLLNDVLGGAATITESQLSAVQNQIQTTLSGGSLTSGEHNLLQSLLRQLTSSLTGGASSITTSTSTSTTPTASSSPIASLLQKIFSGF